MLMTNSLSKYRQIIERYDGRNEKLTKILFLSKARSCHFFSCFFDISSDVFYEKILRVKKVEFCGEFTLSLFIHEVTRRHF